VRVELQFAGRATSWEGTFTVGDEVVEELVDRGAIVPGAPGTVDESGTSDWALLAAGAAAAAVAFSSALAGAIWLVSRKRRRRRAGGAPSSLREGSPGDPARSDEDADSALLLRPAVAESPLLDNGGTAPAHAGGTAGTGMGDRAPVRRAPARTDRASAQVQDSEKDSRAAAAVGATAVVGGALWLLIRARNRTRS